MFELKWSSFSNHEILALFTPDFVIFSCSARIIAGNISKGSRISVIVFFCSNFNSHYLIRQREFLRKERGIFDLYDTISSKVLVLDPCFFLTENMF